jgi:hypothetical protein
LEEEENEWVKGELIIMFKKMLFMEQMCVNKMHGRKLCVTNSCNGVHEMISMNEPLDSLLKELFLLDPP